MRDLTRLASRIVMFFMQFYYRLARHSRVSYKAYIDGRTRLAGYNTIQDNVLLAGAHIGRGTYICRGSNFTDAEVGAFCSIGRSLMRLWAVYLPGKSGNGSTMSRLLICWLRDGGNVRSTNFGKRRTVSRISDCS